MNEDEEEKPLKCPNCGVLLAIVYCGRYPSGLAMTSQPNLGFKIRDILAPVVWGRDVPYNETKRIESGLVTALEQLLENAIKQREGKH